MSDEQANADHEQGLRELMGLMGSAGFACLLSLLNWAKLWQQLHEGEASMTADNTLAMMMPFSGVGVDPFTWQQHGPQVIGVIHNEIAQWAGDEAYRASNTMPWCILKSAAPALANSIKGLQYGSEAHLIINKYFTIGEAPDVPGLAEVSRRAEEQSGNAGVGAAVPQPKTKPAIARPQQTTERSSGPVGSADPYRALRRN